MLREALARAIALALGQPNLQIIKRVSIRAKAGDVGSLIECGAFNVIDHDDISGLFSRLEAPAFFS